MALELFSFHTFPVPIGVDNPDLPLANSKDWSIGPFSDDNSDLLLADSIEDSLGSLSDEHCSASTIVLHSITSC